MTEKIAVDLDGTLIRSDLLWESAVRHVLRTPLGWADVLAWTARGPVELKSRLAERVDLDMSLLPYNAGLLALLEERRAEGAEIVLATAASRPYAEAVAAHLGGFDAVIATPPEGPNLRSAEKARAVDEHFGGGPWTYAGDSVKDLSVWEGAAAAIAVDAPRSVRGRLADQGIPVVDADFPRRSKARAWISQLRVHQWAKNLLVFVPLATAQLLADPAALLSAVLAFLAFSLTASSVYIWNDLTDIDADRRHRSKRHRPIAAGTIPIPHAIVGGTVVGLAGLGLALVVGPWFLVTILAYVVMTTLYSFWLKRKVIIDVTTLALLYTWRLVAGCIAIAVVPTIWLLAFAAFFFFGLALVKRYSELYAVGAKGTARGYERGDAQLVLALGVASSLIAVLVFVLYIDSAASDEAYRIPQILWLAVPLLLYWVSRLWLVTIRGEMHDDPLIYAVRNRVSLATFGLIAIVWIAATVLGG
ncbi:UbiA family prenyltransferase [Agromyces seonyuensis]|uniref:UbiA family prenyltransferase n=1 Tax=Agromyces seonyuensis TaxID=2662446 RepID=A0A6I4NXP9_9MICO|nr:UbiA family prenyltransferase [Agromyces seonyuensis]MWB97912.1 UbiA family prenyltransferase [Agromyces seonyuensis]